MGPVVILSILVAVSCKEEPMRPISETPDIEEGTVVYWKILIQHCSVEACWPLNSIVLAY